jgi:hypothetical protein
MHPALHRERHPATVGMLNLRLRPSGQRVLIKFTDHAVSSLEDHAA